MTVRRIAYTIATAISRRTGRALTGAHNSTDRLRAVLANLVARVNGDRLTAASYLAQVGADAEFIRRYGSAYGKTATGIHRETYGTDPARDGLAVVTRHGRPALVRVNTYPTAVLAKAAARYARTAEMIGA